MSSEESSIRRLQPPFGAKRRNRGEPDIIVVGLVKCDNEARNAGAAGRDFLRAIPIYQRVMALASLPVSRQYVSSGRPSRPDLSGGKHNER
jgi:hypothetical protein